MITKMTGLLVRVLDDEVRLQVGPYEYQVLVPETVRWQVQHRTGQEVTFHVVEYLEGNQGGNRFVPRRSPGRTPGGSRPCPGSGCRRPTRS